METKKLNTWLEDIAPEYPLMIAGPCSAETEEQVLTTARGLVDERVQVFRAGVWKPRTRPGNFEGHGEKALPWLKKVKEETGMKIAIEIANAQHAELALKYDIDILWIGARTSVNPFAVQEIADAIKGSGKVILIKNPVNPDLSLWIGAVERFHQVGMTDIGVIHRGFSTFRPGAFRNDPQWQIALDFKNRYPNIPMILDPSHICGRRDCIYETAQMGLDLQYQGFMIESHHNPDEAWSDAKQQVTPKRLKEIIDQLCLRKQGFQDPEVINQLDFYRNQINHLDDELLQLLAERMKVAEKIGEIKRDKNVSVLQTDRWQEIMQKALTKSQTLDLSERFIDRLFKAIHQESIEKQEKIINRLIK
jgi:chorismate mutase